MLLTTLLLFVLLHLTTACNPTCTFSRCRNGLNFKPRLTKGQDSTLLLRAQERRWLPYICRRLTTYPLRIYSIATGEARIRPYRSKKRYMKISQYRPKGMTHPFPGRYFDLQKFRRGEWVIVRKSTRGNQEKYLDDVCITIPVRGYQYMSSSGKPRGRWKKGGKGDCLSFRTRTAKMLVELRWDSRDDMDLTVVEPGGKKAWRFLSDACGKLSGDVGQQLGVCSNVPDKSEIIRYFDCLPKGKYNITVNHHRNCGLGARYEVRVTRFGKVVYSKVGESTKKTSGPVEQIELEY